jgi:hypothetical protein
MCSGSMSSFVATRLPWRHPKEPSWQRWGRTQARRPAGQSHSRRRLVRSPASPWNYFPNEWSTNLWAKRKEGRGGNWTPASHSHMVNKFTILCVTRMSHTEVIKYAYYFNRSSFHLQNAVCYSASRTFLSLHSTCCTKWNTDFLITVYQLQWSFNAERYKAEAVIAFSESEGIGEDRSWLIAINYTYIRLKGLRKNTTNIMINGAMTEVRTGCLPDSCQKRYAWVYALNYMTVLQLTPCYHIIQRGN